MNLSEIKSKQLKKIVHNIMDFCNRQTGVGTGSTTGYESSLRNLSMTALRLLEVIKDDNLKSSDIDSLAVSLRSATAMSSVGMLSSYESPKIGDDELNQTLAFLDELSKKANL